MSVKIETIKEKLDEVFKAKLNDYDYLELKESNNRYIASVHIKNTEFLLWHIPDNSKQVDTIADRLELDENHIIRTISTHMLTEEKTYDDETVIDCCYFIEFGIL